MKNLNKIIVSIFIGLGLLTGCKKNDWFDVKSDKNLAVPTTLKDMQALMDNTLILNPTTPGMGEVASDGHNVSDVRASALTANSKNAYTWSHEQLYQDVPDWVSGYQRVYYANLVLDGLKKIKSKGSEEQIELNNIKGQALVHRSHAFYELCQVFVPPYEAAYENIKLGIPLRLESDINIPSKRSTVKETYDQIVNDLFLAVELLPVSPLYKTRPSKQAVFALLARVYLSMENYEQAAIFANRTLDGYNTLMDYKTLSTTVTTNPIIGYNPEIIFYTYALPYTPISLSNILIDRSLYDSYQSNDLRKKIFFNVNVSTNLVTYKGTYSGRGFSNCFSGLATDEIYLIRAECYARAGKVQEALADLNTLLKTRWQPKLNPTDIEKPYVDITATDADDALRKILAERKKELILRGLRWSDLRRLNRDERFKVKLSRTVGGKTYTLEPNSYQYTFPIPDDIIRLSGIEQNPGW